MSRAILGLVGLGFFAWGVAAFLMHDVMSSTMGLAFAGGDGLIEFLAINTGLVTAIGVFAVLGAVIDRLRVSAILFVLVFGVGVAGGRIIGLTKGTDPGVYTYTALGIEVSLIALAAFAFFYEKREAARLRAAAPATAPKPEREPTAPSTPTAMRPD